MLWQQLKTRFFGGGGGVEGSEIFLQKRIIRLTRSLECCALNEWKFILRSTLKYKSKGSSFQILHAPQLKFLSLISCLFLLTKKKKKKKERKKEIPCAIIVNIIIVFIIFFWCLDVKLCILLWILIISEWNEGVWCRSFLYTCFSPTTRPKYRAIKKGKKSSFPRNYISW